MKHLIELLANSESPFDVVVHVGAGNCSELQLYRKLAPRVLMLVEANPHLAAELKNKLQPHAGEHIAELAVSSVYGTQSLKIYNNHRESSLATGKRLLSYLPNLKVMEELPVISQPLEYVLESLSIDAHKHNLLVLEIAGTEQAVLQQTDEALLQCFSAVLVRTAEEDLYETQSSRRGVIERMTAIGFKLSGANPDVLFPFCELQFERDSVSVSTRMSVRKIAEQDEQLESLRMELRLTREEHNTQFLRIREEHAAAMALQRAAAEALVVERDELHCQLAKANARTETLLAEAAQLRELLAEAHRHAATQDEQIASLKVELSDVSHQLSQGKLIQDKLETQLVERVQLHDEAKAALEICRADLAAQATQLQDLVDQNSALKQTLRAEGELEALLATERDKNAELERALGERNEALERMARTRDEQDAVARQRDSVIAELESAVQTGRDQYRNTSAELADLRTAHELLESNQALTRQQVTEREAAIGRLIAEKEKLAGSVAAQEATVSALEAALDAMRNDLAGRDEQIGMLAHRLDEQQRRHQLLDNEVIKAEAQIDLICDVLLREPGL